jgi:hypothetical protein
MVGRFAVFLLSILLVVPIFVGWLEVSNYRADQIEVRSAIAQQALRTERDAGFKIECKFHKGPKGSECVGNIQGQSKNDQLELADLAAQQDMSAWAYGMLWVSAIGIGLSAVGVLFIWKTLEATIATLQETKKATIATIALKDSEILKARATVTAFPGGISFEGGDVIAKIVLKNIGLTVAKNVVHSIGFQTISVGQRFLPIETHDAVINPRVLFPETSVTLTVPFKGYIFISDELKDSNARGEVDFVVVGLISFLDVFEQEHAHHFAFSYSKGQFNAEQANILV